MPSFVLTNKVLDDLKEIGRYTERTWGREQHNRYLLILDLCFYDLGCHPTQRA